MALAVGIHKLLELGGALDLEEDFLSILALDFEVELLCGHDGSVGSGLGHFSLVAPTLSALYLPAMHISKCILGSTFYLCCQRSFKATSVKYILLPCSLNHYSFLNTENESGPSLCALRTSRNMSRICLLSSK